MNTKNLVLMALLIGVGTALYFITPGYGNGMKPDFMLTMMFIGILLFPTIKETFLLSILTGVLSGLFSTMPGAFFPNIVDKLITGFIFFAIVFLLNNIAQKLVVGIFLVAIGTLISGSIFLIIILAFIGLPGALTFGPLFITVVIPAMALNAIAFAIIYPIIVTLVKRLKFETSVSHA